MSDFWIGFLSAPAAWFLMSAANFAGGWVVTALWYRRRAALTPPEER